MEKRNVLKSKDTEAVRESFKKKKQALWRSRRVGGGGGQRKPGPEVSAPKERASFLRK